MIQSIIHFSVKQKFIIGLLVCVWIGLGIEAMLHMPIDAVPDITNNQVQIVTVSPSLAAQEIEQLITYPVEAAMANLPDILEVRSISRFSLSVVTIVFKDHIPLLDARQLVTEQISVAAAEIPAGLGVPAMMPITTGLGEIYQYILTVAPGYESQYDAMQLRTVQDWIVKRQLAGTPGVVDISSFGGHLKQYEVSVNPYKMRALEIAATDILTALKQNNQNSGGSYIEQNQNAYYVRTVGRVDQLADIEQICVGAHEGVPILVKDIAQVGWGSAPRYGAMTSNGKGEVVGGITLMLKGANSSEAIAEVKKRIQRVQQSLPEGVFIEPYLDRAELVRRTIETVKNNLIEGGLIVILVLILVSGNLRAGLIVASVIPLSMLFALTLMRVFDVSANLMSLGAIDFGIVVDGAVIIVESILHVMTAKYIGNRLSQTQMNHVVMDAASSIYRSAAFGVMIILVVFIPIMTLTGIEGKMFRPMAYTVSFAILGALILSLTYVPMMSAWVLSKQVSSNRNWADAAMDYLRARYRSVLSAALNRPYVVLMIAIGLLALSVGVFRRLGSEFIPTLEEGDLAMQMTIQPGSALSESIAMATRAEHILLENFPEVERVVSKIGTAEVPTDPMAIEDADIMIILKNKGEWQTARTREGLVNAMKDQLTVITGAEFEFTQPIQLRFNELMTGAKTDIAIMIYGENLDTLAILAQRAEAIVAPIRGAADVRVEQTEGLPQLLIEYDREKMAQYGINIDELNTIIRTAYAGETVGVVYENERKFDLVVRLQPQYRKQLDLAQLFVHLPNSEGDIPLRELASFSFQEGPMQISRSDAQRKITVGVNGRNRDTEGLVEEIERALNEQLNLPSGYYLRYGGQFENLRTAQRRLTIAVPVALGLILILLYFAFHSIKYALLIFTGVPLSAIGGILALALRDMPFSISAGIGFIALFGVSVMDGIVLLSQFNELKDKADRSLKETILEGGTIRLRAVLMTSIVAALGFLPMALSTSAGAEVQKPLATVVIGGIVSATFLTLMVLPVLYLLVNRKSGKGSRSIGLMAGMIAIGMLPYIGNAQPSPEVFTLETAINSAMKHHPLLKKGELQVAREQIRQKGAWQIPPANISYQRGQINARETDYFLTITQSLGSILTHQRQKDYFQTSERLASTELALLKNEVYYEVIHKWYNWRFASNYEILYTQQLVWYDQLTDRLEIQQHAGEIDPLDFQLIQAQQNETLRNLTQAEIALKQAERELKNVTFWENDLIASTDSLVTLQQNDISLSEELAPVLLAPFQQKIALSESQTLLHKSHFFPSLSLGYFYQEIEEMGGLQGFVVEVDIPLWWKSTRTNILSSQIERQIAETEFQHQSYRFTYGFEQAQSELVHYQRQFETLGRSQLEHANALRSLSEIQLNAGEVDYLRYVQLLDRALTYERSYWEMLQAYIDAFISVQYYTQIYE